LAGTLNVDTLKADSNLKLQIASANVAFIDVNGLTIVGNSLNVGGGRIVVTSNNSISTPTVIGANLVTATGTTALGITANGQITTANAPFILTGGQLQFPATQVASADANTLDDYEEGTFTPTIIGTSTAGTATYTNQNAKYTKIGRVVQYEIYLSWGSGTGTGTMKIAGLPFTSAGSPNTFPAVTIGWLNGIVLSANNIATGYVDSNNTTIALEQYPTGGGSMGGITYDDNGGIIVGGTYSI
jgi:hypothetical protein